MFVDFMGFFRKVSQIMIAEMLNAERIQSVIEPDNRFYLSGIEIFDSIDSTNTYLLKKAKENVASGLVCLAEEQTQGRGRLGKSWHSPHGANIYCSMLWRFKNTAQDISGLGIAVGVMVVNALHRYGVPSGLQLKWPNDVLWKDRKLSGILLEKNELSSVVIGIGLNLSIEQANEKNWVDLSELMGQSIKRNFLIGLLLDEILKNMQQFENHGLAPYLSEWQQYDALLNKNIIIVTPEKKISGMMRGINNMGELLLETEKGIQGFRYGEVSVIK